MFKRRVFEILEEGRRGDRLAKGVNAFLVVLIVLNVILSVLETEPKILSAYGDFLSGFQLFSGGVFLLEYICRIYVADSIPVLKRHGPMRARLRYALRPMAVIDLIAAVPLLFVFILPVSGFTPLIFVRLLRFLKLARYSPALRSLGSAIASERRALMGSLVIIGGVVLLASALMYVVEHEVQPQAFGSIPLAMWWAITTVTTVGYGDVIPISTIGKIIGAAVMLSGYGLLALPVGIIASAFSREIHSRDFVVTWSMVARVPLFQGLTAAAVAEVAKLLHALNVRSGDLIAERGDPAEKMFFILEGKVEIRMPHQTIYLSEGDFFGELALLQRRRRTGTIQACEPCRLMVLDAEDLGHLIRREPEVAELIKQVAQERTAALMKHDGDLAEEEIAQAASLASENDEKQPELSFDRD